VAGLLFGVAQYGPGIRLKGVWTTRFLYIRSYCKINSASVSPLGTDQSGELISAELIITGEVIRGT
jgi:hypothetical protein